MSSPMVLFFFQDEEAHAHTDDESDSGAIPGEIERGRSFSSPAATGYGDRAEIMCVRHATVFS